MKHFTSYCQWALVGVLVGWVVVSLLIAPGLYLGDTLSGQTTNMLASLGQAFLVTDVWAVLALELLVDDRPLGYLVTAGDTGVGAGIEPPGQFNAIQLRRQWPGQPQRIGFAQQLLNGPNTELGTGLDLADR